MITGEARLAGVLGWPVSQSRSPRLHGFWLRRYGVDGAYVPLACAPENLPDGLRALAKLGFKGANVTVPHKQQALQLCDSLTQRARRIGAVNTVTIGGGDALYGDNTDGFGFLENLRRSAPGWAPAAGPALVLGAGGAARAIVAVLLDAGVPEVRLANRARARAEALAADHDSVTVVDWGRRAEACDGLGLLVNATTLGMTGQPPLETSLEALPKSAVVADSVYAPLKTGLLTAAKARGNVVVDGLGMLLHQARPGFEAWFGVAPEVTDDLRVHVLAR